MAKKTRELNLNRAKPEYAPSSQEQTALGKYRARKDGLCPAPRLKVEDNVVSPDHPDRAVGLALLMETLGTADQDFLQGLLGQLANACSQGGQTNEHGLNFMVSVVKQIKPRDQIEAMLAAQMAAVQMVTMTFARRLAHAETLQQQDSAERAFNKLTRTYVAQMEALRRYRTGGEQKVTVQHVSVGEGGQAIVGNVTQAPRETSGRTRDNSATSAPALADSQQSKMPIVGDPAPTVVPIKRKSSK
jgi:hypothetical protein